MDAETTYYRYSPRRLTGDYLRSAGGVFVATGVLLTGSPSGFVFYVFAVILLIFGWFGLRTLRMNLQRVAVNQDGIFTKDLLVRELAWPDLDGIKLRYYGSRRQRKNHSGGHMELKLSGRNGTKMSFESSIEGFSDIAWHVAKAAREYEVQVDPTTAGNLLSLGINADEDTPRPDTREEADL